MKKLFYRLLKRAARKWLKRHDPYIIGITGSVGKTTCRMIVADVLQHMFPALRVSTSEKNFNSEVGLVLAIFEIETFTTDPFRVFLTTMTVLFKALFGAKSYDVLVLEYGIDHPGDMEYLISIAQPHMSIFTGLDKVHAAYFETIDELLAEKMKLMQATREITFLPTLAGYTIPYTETLDIDVLHYALHATDGGDIGFHDHRLQLKEAELFATFTLQQEQEEIMHIHTNVLGQEQAGYMSLGIEIGMILERRLQTQEYMFQSEETILSKQQAGRFTIFAGQFGSTLVDSSYNAAPKSMQKTIENTIRLRQDIFPKRDLIYCLGDMRELGDFSEKEHRQLAPLVAQSADAIYLIGEWMTTVMKDELEKLGYNPKHIYTFSDAKDLGEQVLADISAREHLSLILFKGSQNTIFLEESIKPLLKNKENEKKLCRQSKWRRQKKL